MSMHACSLLKIYSEAWIWVPFLAKHVALASRYTTAHSDASFFLPSRHRIQYSHTVYIWYSSGLHRRNRSRKIAMFSVSPFLTGVTSKLCILLTHSPFFLPFLQCSFTSPHCCHLCIEQAKYILDAVMFVADHGASFLPMYEPSISSGEWKYSVQHPVSGANRVIK